MYPYLKLVIYRNCNKTNILLINLIFIMFNKVDKLINFYLQYIELTFVKFNKKIFLIKLVFI